MSISSRRPDRQNKQREDPGAQRPVPACGDWPLAVCSWSLRTGPEGVAQALRQLGLRYVNLALKPVFQENGDLYLETVRRQPWEISATTIGFFHEDYTSLESIRTTGGIVPDAFWDENRDRVLRSIAITAELGVRFLTLHAGFIEDEDPARMRRFRDRLHGLADAAGERGLSLLMETGQETAACLCALLEELNHPALGVNFDPANMILYNKGNPSDAVRMLARWVRHVHIKDALATGTPGTWGAEVPWGAGQVGNAFLSALKEIGYTGVLAIERESGEDRLGDIRLAVERLIAWKP